MMPRAYRAVLALGGNLGDVAAAFGRSLVRLEGQGIKVCARMDASLPVCASIWIPLSIGHVKAAVKQSA